MMKDLNIKQIIIIAIAVIVVVTTIGVYIYKIANKTKVDYDEIELGLENEIVDNVEIEDNMKNEIYVHVTGYVNNSGIVVLKEGDRIIDAIEAAGGEREGADLDKLNLAYVLKDGDKLYVPSIKEKEEEQEYITERSGDNVITGGTGKMENTSSKLVNINTANKAELTTLNGIGESIANKIIAYREENGNFGAIEDIKNVPGIGDSKFEGIKDSITV